jgi:hypothetical protein
VPKPNRRSQRKAAKGSRVRNTQRTVAMERSNALVEGSEEQIKAQELAARERAQGRGDSGRLLLDPKRVSQDIALVRQALAKGYNVTRKGMLRRRLEAIAAKETGDLMTKEGLVDSETKADELAIAAAKVLVMMDQADLKRLAHFEEKPQVPQVGIHVHGDNTVISSQPVDRRTAELVELANALGAKELVVDGRAVPVTELLGSAPELSTPVQERAERSDQPTSDQASSTSEGISDFDLRGGIVRRSSGRRQD